MRQMSDLALLIWYAGQHTLQNLTLEPPREKIRKETSLKNSYLKEIEAR